MDTAHHRRIDLQSPSDLTYLLENIRHSAREKLDLAIPPSAAPAGEDAYRTKVEELVDEYIIQTLTLALPSININGLDPSPSILHPAAPSTNQNTTSISTSAVATASSPTPSEISSQKYEPYDPKLAEKLRTLYATFEDESTKVAELRREAPRVAARAYEGAMEAELRREREMVEGIKNEAETGEKVESGLALGNGLERREAVEKMWGMGVEGLAALGGVTGVLARLERAEKAVRVVEGT